MSRLIVAASMLVAGAAHAYGVFASKTPGRHHSGAAEVVVMRDGATTILTVKRDVTGPREPFVWILPVPETVELDTALALRPLAIDALAEADAPRLEAYWEEDPCEGFGRGRIGYGVGTAPRTKDLGEYRLELVAPNEVSARLSSRGVVLSERAAAALTRLPKGLALLLAEIDPQRVVLDHGVLKLSPLRVQFTAPTLQLALRSAAADEGQELIVHVMTREGRVAPVGLPSLEAPTNVDVRPAAAARFSSLYAGLLARMWRASPGAVITEFAGSPIDACPLCSPRGLSSGYALDELGFDAFAKPPPFVEPQLEIVNAGRLRAEAKQRLELELKGVTSRLRDLAAADEQGATLVLTRLRLRLQPGDGAELVELAPAGPIAGGHEAWNEEGLLEEGAAPANRNAFVTRFVVRHPWTKKVDCEEPDWGRWGDHPRGPSVGRGGDLQGVLSAPRLPSAATDLEAMIDSPVRSLGLGLRKPPAGTSRRGKASK